MPIEVITGQPGNGKTLLMLERLVEESEKTTEQGRRVIVACGIDGLAPGLADITMDDPKQWNAKGPDGKHIIPDGSLIFVDESWKWFGHLHDASRAPTPSHVLDLAEHRHRGLDFVWTTQMPNQIYPFVRGLIGSHTHVTRKMGSKVTELFTWGELCEDVKSQGMRDRALSKIWVFPKRLFDKYKSATQHTIKMKLPWRLILIPASIIGGGLLLWWAFLLLRPETMAATLAGGGKAAAGLPGDAAAAEGRTTGPAMEAPKTAAEWAVFLKPVLPGIAYTAPAFADSLEINTYPQTLCVIAGQEPVGETCHCYTEQVTPVAVADGLCRTIAKERYYDPFKPQTRSREATREPAPVTEAQQVDLAQAKAAEPPVAEGPR